MKLEKISEKALRFSPDDPVSKVAAKMYREKKTEALVFDKGKYSGMFTARDLVKRSRINDPEKVQISNLKAIIKHVKPFTSDSYPDEIIQYLLINGYASVPFKQGEKYGMITKLGLLKTLPKKVYRGRKASDIASYPYCISMDDSIAVAKSIIRQMGLFRVVVVNKSKADGVVDTLDLLNTVVDKSRTQRGERSGKSINLEEVLASSPRLKQSKFITVKPETDLSEIVKKMVKGQEPVAIVQDKKLRGMITPADILELKKPTRPGVLVNITGQQDKDPFLKSMINEEITNFASKIGKMIPIEDIEINIKEKKSGGKRSKYSIKAKLITEKGMFFAQDYSWDLTKTMKGVLSKLEREVKKKIGKERVYGRAPGSRT